MSLITTNLASFNISPSVQKEDERYWLLDGNILDIMGDKHYIISFHTPIAVMSDNGVISISYIILKDETVRDALTNVSINELALVNAIIHIHDKIYKGHIITIPSSNIAGINIHPGFGTKEQKTIVTGFKKDLHFSIRGDSVGAPRCRCYRQINERGRKAAMREGRRRPSLVNTKGTIPKKQQPQ